MIGTMRKLTPLTAAAAAAVMALTATPAAADPPRHSPAHGWRDKDRHDRYEVRYDRRDSRRGRVWRGDDGRYYCKRDNGTTGLIIGAAGSALIGREVGGGRDRTLGTILGAAVGGLLGREIDRGEARCR